VLVFYVEKELHEFDVDLEGRDGLILIFIFIVGGGIGMLDV